MSVGFMIFLYETRSEKYEYFKATMPIAFKKLPQANQIHFIR